MKKTKITTILKTGTIGLLGAITLGGCAQNDKTQSSPVDSTNYEAILEEKDKEIADLQQKLDEMIDERNETEAADKVEDETFQAIIVDLTQKFVDLNQQLSAGKISLQEANTKIESYKTEIETLNRSLAASELDKSALKNDVVSLNNEITNINKLYNAEVVANVELQKEYDELKDKYTLAVERVLKGDTLEKIREGLSLLQTEITEKTTFSKDDRADTNQRLDNLYERATLMQEIAWISDEEYLTTITLIEDLKERDCYNNIAFAVDMIGDYEVVKAQGVMINAEEGKDKVVTNMTQYADSSSALAHDTDFNQVEIASELGYDVVENGDYSHYDLVGDDTTKTGLVAALKDGLTLALNDESSVVEYNEDLDEYTVSYYDGKNQETESEFTYELDGNTLVGYSYYYSAPGYEASTNIEITETTQTEFDTLKTKCQAIIEAAKAAENAEQSEK